MLGRRLPLGLLLAALACSSEPSEPPDTSLSLQAQTGSALTGFAGSRLLGVPLVRVTDAAGDPVTNVVVFLQLADGAANGFSLPETKVATGRDGIARGDVILGAAGQATIRATASLADEEATVVVTAAAPPAIAAVAPESFGPGDELTITGTGFPSVVAGTAVHVGGVPATVLATGPTSMRVRAPACVPAGPASVVVTLNGIVSTNALSITSLGGVSASLAPYEGVTIPAAQAATCLSLAGGGARYLLVPQYATRDDVAPSVASTRPSFVIGSTVTGGPVAAIAPAAEGTPGNAQQRFDVALRRREHALAPISAAAARRPLEVPPLAALELNSTRNFQVLSDLNASNEFTTVTGRLKFIGDDVLVYVDQQAPAGGFTDQQLDALGRLFDQKLYDVAANAFGSPSDIDRNEHVVVLLTPVVNKLTDAEECAQFGYVTGFFYGLDLTPSLANSNKGEIFYSVVPDPAGATGSCAHSTAEVNRMVPSTFVHELQHMISWNQHVIVRGGSDEELWLNEGLSHIAEELSSLVYEKDPSQPRSSPSQLFPDSSQGFITSNVANAYHYLESPTGTSLTLFRDFGSLEERGAAWIFLRWLADQKGEQIFRRLVETSKTGAANVEDKAGEPFRRLFGDFGVAMYADRLPGTDREALPARYRFTSRDFRRIFQRFYDVDTERAEFAHPFPIVATQLEVGESNLRSMVPGTMTWYLLRTTSASPSVALTFAPNGGGTFSDALGAQLSVLRLPAP